MVEQQWDMVEDLEMVRYGKYEEEEEVRRG